MICKIKNITNKQMLKQTFHCFWKLHSHFEFDSSNMCPKSWDFGYISVASPLLIKLEVFGELRPISVILKAAQLIGFSFVVCYVS